MVVLVTGAKGQLGREVIRQLKALDAERLDALRQEDLCMASAKADTQAEVFDADEGFFDEEDEDENFIDDDDDDLFEEEVILYEQIEIDAVDIDELDISDLVTVERYCETIMPDVIINCAALTDVDLCEENIDAAFRANTVGPRNLAIISEKMGASLVHISTDYVFDGEKRMEGLIPKTYDEFEKTNPQTVYGRSKLAGEEFVRTLCKRHFIFRTAWLYGEGNNFVKTMLKIGSEKDEVQVVDDQFGTPTSARALAACILNLMETRNYGVYHASCEGETSWYEFTKEIYRLMKIKTRVIPVTTAEFPRPAPRPKYSVLDKRMLRICGLPPMPQWEEELARYLETV